MGKYLDKIRQREYVTERESHDPLRLGDPDQIVIDPPLANATPVYWERSDMSIVGPGQPEFLAQVGSGPKARYWVVAQFEGQPVWINSIQLRSKRQFEQQPKLKVVTGTGPF